MFIWAELPKGQSSEKMLKFALENNVVYVPGKVFAVESDIENAFRLNFSYLSRSELEEGVRRLEKTYQKYREAE